MARTVKVALRNPQLRAKLDRLKSLDVEMRSVLHPESFQWPDSPLCDNNVGQKGLSEHSIRLSPIYPLLGGGIVISIAVTFTLGPKLVNGGWIWAALPTTKVTRSSGFK